MKTSHYNYLIEKGENLYCFNALTTVFFTIRNKQRNLLEAILSNPESARQSLPSFIHKLEQGGFIIPDDHNELDKIRQLHREACNAPQLSLIILPTLNCNFRCWYCYETHKPTQMNTQTMQALQRYLNNRLNEQGDIKALDISWFGGEPFLYYYQVMQPILSYANELCRQRQIPFASSATTNGFLISEKIAEDLSQQRVNHFQITLDGKREYHNNVRHSLKASSFDTILSNVKNICRFNPNAQILLRINYDEHNLEPDNILEQINERIPEAYRKQIKFLFRRIWQVPPFEEELEKKRRFTQLLNSSGYSYAYEYDLIHDFIPCYAAQKNTLMVTPDGLIGKCTSREDFPKYAIGQLTDEGAIEWKDKSFNDLYATPLFENPQCLSCKQLPICMGECPKIIGSDGSINQQLQCRKSRDEKQLADLILNYCLSSDANN